MIPFSKLVLCDILDCGYADVDYIEELLGEFDLEISDIEWKGNSANQIIRQIFEEALLQHEIDTSSPEWEGRINIYTNCLDSHLYIDDEEMYSAQDIQDKLLALEES
jgi:hypothetical protein